MNLAPEKSVSCVKSDDEFRDSDISTLPTPNEVS